jgi:GH25 family lysozyme M1 (1,4-beta-N-acetylmuramidase)
MTYTPGIDVSRYDEEIDWKMVAAAGYKFAVLRATVGDYYTDPRFYTYWNDAKAAGILVTAYHVIVATNYADKQIARLYSVMGDRKPDFPIVLDIERDDGVSKSANTACIQDCISEIGKHDTRKPMIYTAYYYWKDHVTASSDWAKYDLWVASYERSTPYIPPGWTTWKFWQYSDGGSVAGTNGSTDCDWFNGTYEDLVSYSNGVTQPEPETETGLSARVIIPALNIRSGPGTTYKKVGCMYYGANVNVFNLGGKDVWLESSSGKWSAFYYGGKQYMEIVGGDSTSGIKAKVLYDDLNIRNGPGVTYSSLGHVNTGDVINIVGIGGKDAWAQFDLGKWSAFSYGSDKYMVLA